MAFPGSFDSRPGAFGRRRFLTGALGSGLAMAGASRMFAGQQFWNAKDPSMWTEEEIVILTTKSPWARLAAADVKHADDPTESSNGGPMVGGRGGGTFRPGHVDPIVVRWESAQPILDALKARLPAEFDGHYVISVSNLPGGEVRRPGRGRGRGEDETTDEELLERLQNGATIQPKGRDAAAAGIARRSHIGSILFGFQKDYVRLAPSDRTITFKLDTELLTISTKFDCKDMMYHGKLAV